MMPFRGLVLFFVVALFTLADQDQDHDALKTFSLDKLPRKEQRDFFRYVEDQEPHVWHQLVDEEGRPDNGIEWPQKEVIVRFSSKPKIMQNWRRPRDWEPYIMSPKMEKLVRGLYAVARKSHISHNHFHRLFNERFGRTPRLKRLEAKAALKGIIRSAFIVRTGDTSQAKAFELIEEFYNALSSSPLRRLGTRIHNAVRI